MANHEATLEIWCDAPDYAIVRACGRLGFRTPLDVPWYHLGRYLQLRRHASGNRSIFGWARLFGRRTRDVVRCHCGLPLPELEPYAVKVFPGSVAHYRLGQCFRCHSIFWEI